MSEPSKRPIDKSNWPYSTWPERHVVRVDKSPMNPKIKIAQLNCGHDVYRNRAPRLGATIICPDCAAKAGSPHEMKASTPTNGGLGDDGEETEYGRVVAECRQHVTTAPIKAIPSREPLDRFLERARAHYHARAKLFLARGFATAHASREHDRNAESLLRYQLGQSSGGPAALREIKRFAALAGVRLRAPKKVGKLPS